MTKLLFICLGNICRSPAAEGIMNKMLKDSGLDAEVKCDSCGTSANHIGEEADPRMQEHAERRGYKLESLSRPFTGAKDYSRFDFIFVMDQHNHQAVLAEAPDDEAKKKVYKMTDFCTRHNSELVPDPYYGGPAGFEKVLDILEDACEGVIYQLESRKS